MSSLTRSYAKQKQAERDREKQRKEEERKRRDEQQRLEDENAYSKPLTKKDVKDWVDKKPVRAVTPATSHADILREQESQRAQRPTRQPLDDEQDKKDKKKKQEEPVRLGWDRPTMIGPQEQDNSDRRDTSGTPQWRPYDVQPSNIGLVTPSVSTGPTDIGGGQPESDTRKSAYQPILTGDKWTPTSDRLRSGSAPAVAPAFVAAAPLGLVQPVLDAARNWWGGSSNESAQDWSRANLKQPAEWDASNKRRFDTSLFYAGEHPNYFRDEILQSYFSPYAQEFLRNDITTRMKKRQSDGGGFFASDDNSVNLFGTQAEAAVHELSHAWWEYNGHKKKTVSRFVDAVKRLAKEKDRYPIAGNLAYVYIHGEGDWPGMFENGQWNDHEMFAGLSSGIMGDTSLLPDYLKPYFTQFRDKQNIGPTPQPFRLNQPVPTATPVAPPRYAPHGYTDVPGAGAIEQGVNAVGNWWNGLGNTPQGYTDVPGVGRLPTLPEMQNYTPQQYTDVPGVGRLPTLPEMQNYTPQQYTDVPGVGRLPTLPNEPTTQKLRDEWKRNQVAQQGITDLRNQTTNERFQKGSNNWFDTGLDYLGMAADDVLLYPQKRIENATVPGVGYSLGQLGHAFATALNTAYNPQGSLLGTFKQDDSPIFHREETFWNTFTSELDSSKKAVQYVMDLPDEQRKQAATAFMSIDESGDTLRQTTDALINRDQRIKALEEKVNGARQALASGSERGGFLGAMLQAGGAAAQAQWGAELNKLKNQTNAEIIQERQDPWNQFLMGVVFDPTNAAGPVFEAFGLTPKAIRTAIQERRLAKLGAMTGEEAAQHIGAISKAAEPLVDIVQGGGKIRVKPANWWEMINPLARRTPETMAHLSADSLFKQAVVMLGGITDKETAQAVLRSWVSNPEELARGLNLGTAAAEGITDANGMYRVGAAVLENTPENRAVLAQVADRVGNLESLKGAGTFIPQAVYGELDNTLYAAARRGYGLDKLTDVPVGTARTTIKNLGKEKAVIQYLDSTGKVLGQTDEMTKYEAEVAHKAMKDAAKQSGGALISGVVQGAGNIQRAILSDMWLNMRPGHWIRNAMAATATLIADDVYTLESTASTQGYLRRKGSEGLAAIGEAATERGVERGITNVTGGQENWSRKFWPKYNPYAAISEAGSALWSGNTAIAGRVPFGEASFRLRAYKQGFQRFFDPHWTETVAQNFVPALTEAGVPEDLARQLAGIATSEGIRGNKSDVLRAIRTVVNENTIPIDLATMGVRPDTFLPEEWTIINDVIRQYGPGQEQEAIAAIRSQVGQQAADRYTRIISQAPPQMGRAVWTEREVVQDGADIIDVAVEAAKRSGQDPEVARKGAEEFTKGIFDASKQMWDTFFREATADNNSNTFGVIMDAWSQIQDLRTAARGQVDELSRIAIKENTPEAWAAKWAGTQDIYGRLVGTQREVFDQARIGLASTLRGGEYKPKYDFWKNIKQYVDYDEQAVQATRQSGLGLNAAVGNNPTTYSNVINANRQFVDRSFTELMATFRQFPNMDSMDLVINAQKQIDHMAAQVTGYLAEQRDLIPAGHLSSARYDDIRNRAWYQFFDNAAVVNNATKYEIVLDGLAKQTETQLRWVDDFAQSEYKVMYPTKDNMWVVKQMEDGRVVTLPGKPPPVDSTGSQVVVPQQVQNDWYRIVGENDKIVEQTLADISSSIPEPAANPFTPVVPTFNGQPMTGRGVRGVWRAAAEEAPTSIEKPKPIYTGRVTTQFQTELDQLFYTAGSTGRGANGVPNTARSRAISRLESMGYSYEEITATAQKVRAEWKKQYYALLGKNPPQGSLLEIPNPIVPPPTTSSAAQSFTEQPVEIIRSTGLNVAGDETYLVRLADGSEFDINKDELWVLSGNNELHNLNDVQAMMDASQAIDMTDVKSIEEARKLYRTEWDRVAKGSVGIKGSIDNFVSRFYRRNVAGGGEWIIQLPDKLPGIEDLYGETLAGRRINGQADLEDFLQEYVNMKRQADAIKRGREGAQEAYTSAYNRRQAATNVDELRKFRTANPYTVQTAPEGLYNPLGMAEDGPVDARTLLRGTDPTVQPSTGDVAKWSLEQVMNGLDAIEHNISALLTGTPNTLTDAQRLRVIDAAANLGAHFDNVAESSANIGQQVADFAMLNFRDRRNMDVVLSTVFPYHYFWTRSAKNWAWRVATKPAIANFYYEAQRAVETENKQGDVPYYLEGTLPNPLHQYGIGEKRVGNPLDYAMPFKMYMPNEFVNPDEAKNEGDRFLRNIQQFTPGLLPAFDIALKVYRGELDQAEIGDYVPFYRMGGYAYQAITGKVQKPGPLNYSDAYNLGRVGKEIALAVIRGDVDPILSKWAMDKGWQIKESVGPLPEEPEAAKAIWEANAKQAGVNKLWSSVMGYVLGLPMYPLTDEEIKMRDMKQTRQELGYSDTNPLGSTEAQRTYDATTQGALSNSYQYSGLYAGNEDRTRPGASAAYDMKRSEQDTIYADMQAAVEKYLMENPNAAKKDVDKIKSPFFDQLEALKDKYPSSSLVEFSGNPPSGANPFERARWELERIIKASDEGKPAWPGDNADDATMQQYYTDLAAFKEQKYDAMERAIKNTLATPSDQPDFKAWQEQFRQMTQGQYASELDRNYDLRFASDIERDWSDVATLKSELSAAGWDEREAFIQSEFGKSTLSLWQQYNNMEKGSKERDDFYAAHPELSVVNTAAYNPTQYEELKAKFGEDAWSVYKGRPEHPGEDASKAELDAYYKKLDDYEAKHPGSSEISFWLNGLRKPDGLPAEYYRKDFGNDYAEAQRIFGENIFELDAKTPASKQAYYNYMDAHPQLYGFREWKKQYAEMTPEQYMAVRQPPTDAEGMPALPTYYTGERPVGSGRAPIGGEPSAPQGIWPSADLSPGLQQQQAQRPMDMYTQAENQFRGAQATPLQEPLSNNIPISDQLLTSVGGSPESPMWQPTPEEGSLTDLTAAEQPLTMSADEQGNTVVNQPVETPPTTGTGGGMGNEAQQWMNKSSGYQKAQEWIQRGVNVENEFGADARATWNAYLDLPEGDARAQYRAEHPEMKVYNLAAYNQEEYQVAKTMFGQDTLLAWARAPVYDGTPEQNEKRNRYWKENPQAFVAGAWVNGRPSADTEGDRDPLAQWTPDLGADYATAMDMFGENIWSVVARQKALYGDKRARSAFYKQFPQYMQWSEWWYANLPDTRQQSTGLRSGPGYDSLGHRAYGSWGGGGGGGARRSYINMPDVYAQKMSGNLWNSPGQDVREWRPFSINMRDAQVQAPPGKILREWR